MASSQDVANFLIIGATPGSNPPSHNHVYPPNSTEYTFVASAIGIGLRMLEHPRAQQMMTALAMTFDNARCAEACSVSWFVRKFKQTFPVVYIHEGTTNADILRFYQRSAWEGGLLKIRFPPALIYFTNQPTSPQNRIKEKNKCFVNSEGSIIKEIGSE
jgi:hypothetical protein